MTDAELIAWLREIQGQAGLFASAAADRIEALIKERDAALHLAHTRKAFVEEARDERDAFEAKLAKAVEALELIVVDNTWGLEHQTYMKCRTTLAEIKGESHE